MKDTITMARLKEIRKIVRRLKQFNQEHFDTLHELELIVALWIESLEPKRKKK